MTKRVQPVTAVGELLSVAELPVHDRTTTTTGGDGDPEIPRHDAV